MTRVVESTAQIAAVLGHELRNPLAAAVTGTALVREMIDADDPRRPVVDSVAQALQRMSDLITSYLAFLRGGSGDRQLVELQSVCQTVAARRTQTFVHVTDDAVVMGDPLLFERICENLIDNARQAGATEVRLQASRVHDRVKLFVQDDGPGIAAEDCKQVFEAGFSRRGSTGLGLTIVEEVIRAQGGSIEAMPSTQGARFVIDLPAATPVRGEAGVTELVSAV